MSALGSNIKFLREHHNITPLAMSKKLKISLQDYNAWESGLSLPTISNVMDVCAVYGLKNPTINITTAAAILTPQYVVSIGTASIISGTARIFFRQ